MAANNSAIQLTEMERDIIGEVMNISMGSAATAMSTILDKKVSITAPRLSAVPLDEFEYVHLEPVLGVLIKYIEGISGSNMLLLKVEDFKKILSHLLNMDMSDVTEFDEISISAICEIMNQMMGSAASALATFLGIAINISPPEVLDTIDKDSVKDKLSLEGPEILTIAFDIQIEDLVKSEFISILEPRLAREIVTMSLGENSMQDIEVAEATEAYAPEPPAAAPEVTLIEPVPVQEVATPPPLAAELQAASPPPPAAPVAHAPPRPQTPQPTIQATPYSYPDLKTNPPEEPNGALDNNLQLIMSVPVQITVELGKTKRKIKDIAEFAPGNIIELERQAGDQVDIVANGRLIAKGDVVVVDDNYSVRITEIMRARDTVAEVR